MKIILREFYYIFRGIYLFFFKKNGNNLEYIENNGYKFMISEKDRIFINKIRKEGGYQNSELLRYKKLFQNSINNLIIGSHIGLMAIPLSQSSKTLYCVEANPETYEIFKKNINLNKIENIKTYNFAAGNVKKEIFFLKNNDNSGGSKIVPKKIRPKYFYDIPQKIKINQYKLDNYFKEIKFDVIIIDIEGSEHKCLLGMKNILKDCKFLVIEFIPYHIKEVANISIDTFLDSFTNFFDFVEFPKKNKKLSIIDAKILLKNMYLKNEFEDGIIFSKKTKNNQ